MDGKIQYTIFYTAFLLFLIFIGSVIPVETITGITKEQIEQLAAPITLPPEPTVLDYVIFPFAALYSILNKFIILLSVSTIHQGLGIVITPFTIGMLVVIVEFIRG